MKKLFTIAALSIFMFSLTSYTPNEVGGGGKIPGGVKAITINEVGGGGKVPVGV